MSKHITNKNLPQELRAEYRMTTLRIANQLKLAGICNDWRMTPY